MSVCPSVRPPSVRPSVRKLTEIPAGVLQNVTDKSYLVCFGTSLILEPGLCFSV